MDESMKKALESGDCEITPPGARSEQDFRDEMIHRSWKSGQTTRLGECPRASKIMAQGFGESKLNVWPRDKNGVLIN